MLGFLIFFSLVGVVVFSILCVFASLTVKLIKKHNRASSNRHPRAKLAFFFRCTPILSLDTSKRAKAPVLFYVITSIRNHWLRTGMIPLCLSLSIINAQ